MALEVLDMEKQKLSSFFSSLQQQSIDDSLKTFIRVGVRLDRLVWGYLGLETKLRRGGGSRGEESVGF